MRKQSFAILIANLILISVCQRSHKNCVWTFEWLCGDMCLGTQHLCTCGNETVGFPSMHDFVCCHTQPCRKDFDGNVQCNDGKKQRTDQKCNNECLQSSDFGFINFPCNSNDECYRGIDSCQGVPECEE